MILFWKKKGKTEIPIWNLELNLFTGAWSRGRWEGNISTWIRFFPKSCTAAVFVFLRSFLRSLLYSYSISVLLRWVADVVQMRGIIRLSRRLGEFGFWMGWDGIGMGTDEHEREHGHVSLGLGGVEGIKESLECGIWTEIEAIGIGIGIDGWELKWKWKWIG